MNHFFIYPQNLKAQATLWLWSLKDITVIGIALLVSVLALSQVKLYLPLALTLCYAFLTIRYEDTTIKEFIKRAVSYFLTAQQYFEWKKANERK